MVNAFPLAGCLRSTLGDFVSIECIENHGFLRTRPYPLRPRREICEGTKIFCPKQLLCYLPVTSNALWIRLPFLWLKWAFILQTALFRAIIFSKVNDQQWRFKTFLETNLEKLQIYSCISSYSMTENIIYDVKNAPSEETKWVRFTCHFPRCDH